ncbi:hypothetical protein CC80DRAFT_210265 [Byssothecium circinans]|uniref:Uncharacterized protein n=1 Tax=Byssothecium circinans TaxID=147558 RepID=A0A6A5TEW7_9PLEO|nr:hypothetical protein CC80DRAFT_210265 [Byssothecium circinans]
MNRCAHWRILEGPAPRVFLIGVDEVGKSNRAGARPIVVSALYINLQSSHSSRPSPPPIMSTEQQGVSIGTYKSLIGDSSPSTSASSSLPYIYRNFFGSNVRYHRLNSSMTSRISHQHRAQSLCGSCGRYAAQRPKTRR